MTFVTATCNFERHLRFRSKPSFLIVCLCFCVSLCSVRMCCVSVWAEHVAFGVQGTTTATSTLTERSAFLWLRHLPLYWCAVWWTKLYNIIINVTPIKPPRSLKVTHRSFRRFTPSLEPASYITQDSSSKLFIPSQRPSFEHAGLTCYILLSPSITFSLFHSELKPTCSENLTSTLVCFCLSDWSHGSRPSPGLTCSSVFMF